MIAIDKIRTIDKTLIIKVFEKLTNAEIEKFKEMIKETYVD
ncbi:hypothetical protein GCM10011312_04290 [Planktosalinus lacus]|uniref:Uncharacterized protein n=1 Tax=Planktosalinus lacus TaxID=1526573 RepID=A0A8J2Y571_9FLAO|nr:hypothetical protein [Planktosalinus lacus]GGD83343.1 hypothetical protein GCM10011312_04290 [Planktosalinus lacus]